jgi:hypothetical protein
VRAPVDRARRAAAAALSAWDGAVHRPEPVVGIALVRVLVGLVLLLNWALLSPDVLTWFGARGVLSSETARRLTGEGRLNVLAVLPPSDAWAMAFFWLTVLATLGLAAGYRTRWSTALTFLGLVSLHHRNPLILNSGDTLLRAVTFLLIFAPAGDALSVDRLVRRRRAGAAAPGPVLGPPWPRRLIQCQVALLYLSTAWWKLQGETWRDGTAAHYVLRLAEFQRFPLPFESWWIESLAVTRLLTWSSLGVELALGVLIWVPALRYPVLALGVAFHLALEYALNIPVFQWAMLACLVAFVPPADLVCAGRWLAARAGRAGPAPAPAGAAGEERR